MVKRILWSGDITLPAPTEISVNDEIIWSSNTGRAASGEMTGDVVTEKKNISIKWGILEETEIKLIKEIIIEGFFPLSFRDDGIELTITSYRGTLTKEHLGWYGGTYFYKNASVSIIEK